ncbi:MAG: transcriptional repressor [Phycisphaeraceae bacterium]|nr:transcriptional repressor [Phycisphaeraceae bacterium]
MHRRTRQREAIMQALSKSARPLSPAELLKAAGKQVKSLSLATVYRNVKSMVEEGLIHPVQLPGEPPRYELHEAAARHHHHFHCETCDRVFDIAGCPKGLESMVPVGFSLRAHELVLYGRCSGCSGAARS